MSGLFTKKYVEQSEFQEGEVPDDHSDQPEPNIPLTTQPKIDKKKQQPEEDEFIFETVPDNQLEDDFKTKQKQTFKGQDYYQQQQPKKEWEKHYEKQKTVEKTMIQKAPYKKDMQSLENKRKPETILEEPQIRTGIPAQMPLPQPIGYYPNISPVPAPYLPPGYYPPYGPQPGARHPYAMYPPQMHQPPATMYVPPPPQGPYQVPNAHMYQIPPPIPYGTVPMVQPIPDLYRMEHPPMMQSRQGPQQQIKPYGYEQSTMLSRGQPQSPYNQPPKFTLPQQRQTQTRQRQDPRQAFQNREKLQDDHRYAEERQRSRNKKEFHEYESGRQERKQKYPEKSPYQSKPSYDQIYKDTRKDNQFSSSQSEKKTMKDQKKSLQQQIRSKLKNQVGDNLKILFGTNNDEKEEFLFVLRDVLKYRLLKRQEEELSKFNNFDIAKPVKIYTHNKEIIESNHEKALLKLENYIITLAQNEKNTNSQIPLTKRESLFKILSSLQLDDLITKIKEMRLKKKLIGERKMSEIKRLLQELVKDPRKRIK